MGVMKGIICYMKKRCFVLIFAALFFISAMASCNNSPSGDSGNTSENTPANQSDGNGSDSLAAEEYVYPSLNGEGRDFTFLNVAPVWDFYTTIVHESTTSEVLDDAIYARNRLIEEKFNINIKEVTAEISSITDTLRTMVKAGENLYDTAYCPASFSAPIGSLITDNYLMDLNEISSLNLNKNWWNQTIMKEAVIGDSNKLYYTSCDINIMDLQAMSCVFFNQDMMTDLGLELPYNTVKEGKWTFDTFYEYMKAGTNLNGAESFAWDVSGSAVYGLTSYDDSSTALLAGAEARLIMTDSDNNPYFAADTAKFYDVMDKISTMLLTSGNYLFANESSSGFYYEQIFMNNRALMLIGELKAADVFRSMDSTFGVLPIPKYNESQENYYSHLIYQAPVLVIPVTNNDSEFTGAVLDAMAYVSNKDVTPVFFDLSVSQKQLRNDESVEMLRLIRNSGSFEVGSAYGWTADFYKSIRSSLGMGKSFNTASEVEKNREAITKNIEKTMEFFNK